MDAMGVPEPVTNHHFTLQPMDPGDEVVDLIEALKMPMPEPVHQRMRASLGSALSAFVSFMAAGILCILSGW